MQTRREFMTHSAGAAGAATLLSTGLTLPGFLTRSALAAQPNPDERILVVIQLSGGNDGLNMIIPFEDDAYQRARPTLAVNSNQVHRLSHTGLGLHPDMVALKSLFDDGDLTVLNNVGYPNPNRSHFQSMDIWHTARLASGTPHTSDDGWLGRVVDAQRNRETPAAVHFDDGALPLALKTQLKPVPSIRSLDSIRLTGDTDELQVALAAKRQTASDDLLFVQRLAVSSCENARRIERLSDDGTAGGYPQFKLAERLRQIAQLIGAGFGARIYYTSIGGFDTHARQQLAHGPLLRELADSLAAFQRDLKRRDLHQRVLTLTFSEFGRRVKENGSRGTDHGAAAPVLLVGATQSPGVIGGPPDLGNLLDGDLRHETDFRQIYATVLDDWLGVDHRPILGRAFSAPQDLSL